MDGETDKSWDHIMPVDVLALNVWLHVHGFVHQLVVVVSEQFLFHSSRRAVGDHLFARRDHLFARLFDLVLTSRSETVLCHLSEQVIRAFVVHFDFDGSPIKRELVLRRNRSPALFRTKRDVIT